MMTAGEPKYGRSLRWMTMMMIGFLLIQFLWGMYVNLFVSVPSQRMTPGQGMSMSGMGQMFSIVAIHGNLLAHMILGLLLAFFAVVTTIMAFNLKRPSVTLWVIVGLFSVLFGGYGGMTFLMNGQHNSDSFIMAIGWLAAFTAYFAAMQKTRA